MAKQILRKATETDREQLLLWANEPECRKNSLHSHLITREEHSNRFAGKLDSENCPIYILEEKEKKLGQVRIDLLQSHGRISYSIDKGYRGLGYGKLILCLFFRETLKDFPDCQELIAEVKKENVASQRIFEEFGFTVQESGDNTIRYMAKPAMLKNIKRPEIIRGGVLLLSNNRNAFALYEWLLKKEKAVYFYSGKLDRFQLQTMHPKFIISYNYQYIVPNWVIELYREKIWNLHISYLPWNRGSSPNFWSFIENSPKGVTIHEMDTGLDTGKILVQKELFFDESKESFASTYETLNQEILQLFKENWDLIKAGRITGTEQRAEEGSIHNSHDFACIMEGAPIDWSENIREYKMKVEKK